MRMHTQNILIALLAITGAATQVSAQRALPENNLSYPVFVSLANGDAASGFYLNTSNRMFFVTARHVLINTENPTNWVLKAPTAKLSSYSSHITRTEKMDFEIHLERLLADGKLRYDVNQDVAVAHIGDINTYTNGRRQVVYSQKYFVRQDTGTTAFIGADLDNIKLFDDVFVGNDIYLFGYPSSIGMKQIPQLDYDTPLLRKGSIAGKNAANSTIVLDCPTYYGNSGGPVVQVEFDGITTKFIVIGVVSQFVPFAEEWENKKHRYLNLTISNSGYSIATPMDPVLSLLRSM